MVQELIRALWCDHCRYLGEGKQEGSENKFTINGKSYEAELCPHIIEQLVTPLVEGLETWARRPADAVRPRPLVAPQGQQDVYPCPICPDRAYGSGVSLNVHLKAQHNGSTGSSLLGNACPLDGEKFASYQGLATHVRSSHSGMTAPQAFIEARALGDPHGIVATRGLS